MNQWVSESRDKIREIETDLADQGLKLFPNTRAGHHAQLLWRKIKRHLLRGSAIQITAWALGLEWHREELRRARQILVTMELVRPRTDGLYVLGCYDCVDELVRESFLDLKALEAVIVVLGSLMTKSKTQSRRSDLGRHKTICYFRSPSTSCQPS